jgi:hypothetical protein
MMGFRWFWKSYQRGHRQKSNFSWSCIMPRSASLVPDDTNPDVYLVLDDFGSLGRVWRETDEAGTNRAWMVRNILEGLYENPVRIVAFNTAEGWSRDVTVDVADELRRRFVEYDEVSESVLKFLEATNRRWASLRDVDWWQVAKEQLHAAARATFIKSLEDSTVVRAYPTQWALGDSHGHHGAILHRCRGFERFAHRRDGLALMS